jgi:hypothetical protein
MTGVQERFRPGYGDLIVSQIEDTKVSQVGRVGQRQPPWSPISFLVKFRFVRLVR